MKDGILFSENDVKSSAKVCLLGQTVVDNLFAKGEDPIGKIIRFKKIPLQVIGVLAIKGQSNFGQDQDDIIIAPYTTVMKRILATTYIQNIYASATSEAETEKATDEINTVLRETHKIRADQDDDFTIRTMAELIKMLSSTTGMMTTLLTAVAGISLVIGGIGINEQHVCIRNRENPRNRS